MVDPQVIAALEESLRANAAQPGVRLHVAGLLFEAGRAQDALRHCAILLESQPDHAEALALAAKAADAAGETAKASAYRRLAAALAPAAEAEKRNVVPLRVVRGDGDGEPSDEPWEIEVAQVRLEDVAGMEEVKRRLNLAFLAPMRNPEISRAFGKGSRGGLLLYGPPGCGKTFVARALAGELGAKFMSIGLSDVLEMWLGESERNLHEIFQTARRNVPCVIFFDEIDALGRKRSLLRQSAEHNVVNQLLAELDSVNSKNDGLFILAATNHPWDVDAALRRPGRLDRTLFVAPPDEAGAEAILRFNLQNRLVEEGLDLRGLASKLEGFSGADVAHLCDSAAELALEESLASGEKRPIGMGDLKRALKDLKPSTGAWFETARNFALFGNDGGAYDDLLAHLRRKRLL